MSYIEKNLMPGESIVYEAKMHWIVFMFPFFFLILSVWFLFGLGADAVSGVSLLFLGFVATGVSAFINYKTSEFGVTNKRVIIKVGFIRRKSAEILLAKIEGIQVDQSIIGRLLNYGSITATGTGGTKDPFKRIADPLNFRTQVQQQIVANETQKPAQAQQIPVAPAVSQPEPQLPKVTRLEGDPQRPNMVKALCIACGHKMLYDMKHSGKEKGCPKCKVAFILP